jgi:DNA (cytosine-5)-methyltransferase 1
VLEEITKTEIPMPANNKWADSGMVEWNGGSLAWRVLDAQGWGVPQRRRRIFLVADFDGRSAGEILFIEQGSNRHFKESEGEREETATDVGASTDSASGFKYRQGAKAGGIGWQNGKAPTLELSQNCAVYESHPSDCRVKGPVKVSPACTAKWHKGSADTPLVAYNGESNDLQDN